MNDLATRLYEAYRVHTGGKSAVTGAPIPEWTALSSPVQDAWKASARAAILNMDPRPLVDALEQILGLAARAESEASYLPHRLGEIYAVVREALGR
jgi:hypothetical protein